MVPADPAPGTGATYDPGSETESEAQKQTPQVQEQETVTIPRSQLDEILTRVKDLEDTKEAPRVVPQDSLHIGEGGEQIGLHDKFSVNAEDYGDPTDKLAHEPQLRRFGFLDNFILTWQVVPVQYKTIFGANYREPRFELTLYQRYYDENGDPVVKDGQVQLILRKRGWFHEDKPEVERAAADLGLKRATPELYEQVRYERIKRHLIDWFYPPKNADVGGGLVETVIDGQVVQLAPIGGIDMGTMKVENYTPEEA